MSLVTIDDPPRMSLLGLILASIIERKVAADPVARQRFEKLTGKVVVQAGEMIVTLDFGAGALAIRRGEVGGARASVRGSLDALMGLALGGGMIGPVLAGRLKPRGNLFFLLRLKRLLRVA